MLPSPFDLLTNTGPTISPEIYFLVFEDDIFLAQQTTLSEVQVLIFLE